MLLKICCVCWYLLYLDRYPGKSPLFVFCSSVKLNDTLGEIQEIFGFPFSGFVAEIQVRQHRGRLRSARMASLRCGGPY